MANNDGSSFKGWSLICGVPSTVVALATAPPLGVLTLAATVAAYQVGSGREQAAAEKAEDDRIDQLQLDCDQRGARIAEWKLGIAAHQRRWDDGDIDTSDLVHEIELAWARYPAASYPAWFIQYAGAYAGWFWEGEQLLTRQLDESEAALDDEALWTRHQEEMASHTARMPRRIGGLALERRILEKEALRCGWERGMAEAFRRYDEGEIDTDQYEEELLTRAQRCPE